MNTQLAIIKPARRAYDTSGHDELIIGLGEELQALADERKRLDTVASETADDHNRLRARTASDETFDKMNDICSTLAALKAGSLEAAAIQLRAISYYSSMDYEEVERKISTLIHSVLGALESNGGFSRDRWAGAFYLGVSDAFERVEL